MMLSRYAFSTRVSLRRVDTVLTASHFCRNLRISLVAAMKFGRNRARAPVKEQKELVRISTACTCCTIVNYS